MPRHSATPGATIATANVAGVAGEIQAVAGSFPRDWSTVVTRTITGADFAGESPWAIESLPLASIIQAGDAWGFQVYGHSDTPGAYLVYTPILRDEAGAVISIGTSVTLTAVTNYTVGGQYPAVVSPGLSLDPGISFAGASSVAIVVQGFSAGTWTLCVKVF